MVERAGDLSARLFGVDRASIGFVSSVAKGMSLLVDSLDWRQGDSVCVDANEYPSLVAPLRVGLPPWVEVRFAPMHAPEAAACGSASTVTRATATSLRSPGDARPAAPRLGGQPSKAAAAASMIASSSRP
jgi:selenocysteine lyase/cysteine desulfurase